MKAISFEDYKKRIKKNAKKGVYKKTTPPGPIKTDTATIRKPVERIAEPATVPTTVAAPIEPTVDPILKADSLIILSEVLFELNSYKLKGAHFSALDSLGAFLKAHPTLEVIVSGHTDSTGTERHNVVLSTWRAEVVAEYLIDKGAVFERVNYEGFGSAFPIQRNNTPEGRSKNRRVEILIRNPVRR